MQLHMMYGNFFRPPVTSSPTGLSHSIFHFCNNIRALGYTTFAIPS